MGIRAHEVLATLGETLTGIASDNLALTELLTVFNVKDERIDLVEDIISWQDSGEYSAQIEIHIGQLESFLNALDAVPEDEVIVDTFIGKYTRADVQESLRGLLANRLSKGDTLTLEFVF